MCECEGASIAASVVAGVNGQFCGGGLKIFFNKLCGFLKGGALLVFVLDGDRCLEFKRGSKVIDKPIWWTEKAIEIIGYFGYYYYKVCLIELCTQNSNQTELYDRHLEKLKPNWRSSILMVLWMGLSPVTVIYWFLGPAKSFEGM